MALKRRQKFGKYRIEGKLAEGGFATIYRAYDTIEGIHVALKLPLSQLVDRETLNLFRNEVKVNARLDHPNILPIKYAGFVDGQFVIVYPLGIESLADRLGRRVALRKALDWAEQILVAVAFAHRKRILHSDLKPENFIMFPGDQIRLADFGLAKVSYHTLSASGSGTLGYLAPEQAMGKPSLRSDVFSLGLIIYKMLSGSLPEWPFDWPPPGYDRIRRKLNPDMIAILGKAMAVDDRRRFGDATKMQTAFCRVKPRALARLTRKRRKRSRNHHDAGNWQRIRLREFLTKYRAALETGHTCHRCGGPVSEPMKFCCWCRSSLRIHRGPTRFPARCGRCKRGRKLDWRFCPWCYGGSFRSIAERSYSDVRYSARCANTACADRRLMPFMTYCPWCNRKVKRPWKIPGSMDRCGGCGWGVLREFWSCCPWCARGLEKK